MRIILSILLAATLSGCNWFGGFRPPEIVKHPDAPVLIAEVKGNYIRGYVYDKAKNELTDFGWIKLENSNAVGWTLFKYNWDKVIQKEAKARESGSR